MSSSPNPDDQDARTQRHLAFLDTLIAHGMDLANRIHQQATTPAGFVSALAAPGIAVPFITPDIIAAFAQINQTVRRAILVSRKLAETIPPARLNPDSSRTSRVREAAALVPQAVDRAQAETFRTEAVERLHSPDLEDRIGNRPVPEIIAGLCRDLGMATPPEYLDPQNHAGVEAVPPCPTPPAAAASPAHLPEKPPEKARGEIPDDDADAIAATLQRRALFSKPEPRPPKR